jgi:hypothetical protein
MTKHGKVNDPGQPEVPTGQLRPVKWCMSPGSSYPLASSSSLSPPVGGPGGCPPGIRRGLESSEGAPIPVPQGPEPRRGGPRGGQRR